MKTLCEHCIFESEKGKCYLNRLEKMSYEIAENGSAIVNGKCRACRNVYWLDGKEELSLEECEKIVLDEIELTYSILVFGEPTNEVIEKINADNEHNFFLFVHKDVTNGEKFKQLTKKIKNNKVNINWYNCVDYDLKRLIESKIKNSGCDFFVYCLGDKIPTQENFDYVENEFNIKLNQHLLYIVDGFKFVNILQLLKEINERKEKSCSRNSELQQQGILDSISKECDKSDV